MERARRVTANLPAKLLREATKATRKGITETLIEGLRLVQRAHAYEKALALRGRGAPASGSGSNTCPEWSLIRPSGSIPDAHIAQCALERDAVLLAHDAIFERVARWTALRLGL